MNDTFLVGIDLALGSVRVTAYDENGDIQLNGRADVEQPGVEGWEAAIREAAVYLPQNRTIVSTVGTSGTVVPVDAYGNAVFDPQWYYETAPAQEKKLTEFDLAEELSNRGVSLSATSPLAKILQLRKDHPNRFDDVEWLLSPATWLLYRLHIPESDQWTDLETDWTNALKFGADITAPTPGWFEPLFEAVDVSLELFPTIRAPGSPVGHAESELAEEVGLANAELYQGLTDGNASVLASGCLQPGDCSIVSASTSVIKYVSESIKPHDALYYHRHPIKGYIPGAAFDSGVILRWFCEQILSIERAEGLKLAREIDAGEEPRVFVQGDRSPFFDPQMGTTMFDLWSDDDRSVEEERGRLIRGLISGIALSEYTYFPLLEDHFNTDIDQVHLVSGGEAGRDDPFSWWNKLRASIWDREILKMEPRTTIGPLIPASLTASVYDDVNEASDQLLRINGKVPIDDHLRNEYMDRKDEFARDWSRVNELYQKLTQ